MARILVVDDDRDILVMAEKVLATDGHTVFVAEDALRALDWLNQIAFDLVITDANMPHHSGFELIGTLRKDAKFKDLTIAMLTSLRERKDIERAVALGVNDYIVKPLDPMLLLQKVAALFAKNAPQKHPEIQLRGTPRSEATLHRPVEVESLSELGLVLLTKDPLKAGETLKLSAQIFTELDIEPPALKVLNVEIDSSTGMHRSQVIFLGAREAMLQKIRRWLYNHASSNKMAG